MLLKTFKIKALAYSLFFFLFSYLNAQVQNGQIDAPGDIAFIAWNDHTDGFAFVLMDDCPSSTYITFTDEEWTGTGFAHATSEGEVKWTNTTGSELPKGTVIIIESANSIPNANIGFAQESELGVNFNDAGDQWYAFTGPNRANHGTFIAFYGPLIGGATLGGTGLVLGETAIEFAGEYMYTGSTNSDVDMGTYLEMIYDTNNWTEIDDAAAPPPFPDNVPTEFTGAIFTNCAFNSMVAGTRSDCDGPTNSYTQEVTLTYENAPSSGTIDILGQSFAITSSPQTIVLTGLNADELYVNVTASFSANPGCSIYRTGLFQAPPPCCTDVRLNAVDPYTGHVTIKNCGDCSLDVSNYRLNSEYSFTDNLHSLPLISGSLALSPNDEVTVQWTGIAPNNDGGADLALYTPSGSFVVADAIVDFVQWGSGGNGWESTAVTAGIWTADDHLESALVPPYIYSGTACGNHGLTEWSGTTTVESLTTDACTSTGSFSSLASNRWQHLRVGGAVLASIKDNGNDLGTVTADFYINSGAVRDDGNQAYLDRSFYITPTNQPTTPVTVRLYLTDAELNAIIAASPEVNDITDLNISKYSDAICAPNYNGSNGVLITAADITVGNFGADHYLEFDVDGFSGFFPQAKAALLPVELVYFKAEQIEKEVHVTWATASERNNDYFIVERSYNGTEFEQIGFVKGAGTDNQRNEYQYIDNTILEKRNVYYRLVQMDFDGTNTTSDIAVVKFDLDDLNAQLVPNLVSTTTTISFNKNLRSDTDYLVFDINGHVYMKGTIPTGLNSFELNTTELSAGTYFIKLIDQQSYFYSSRFVKILD